MAAIARSMLSCQATNLARIQEKRYLDIREAYQRSLLKDGHDSDPAQLEIVARLETLQKQLQDPRRRRSGLFSRLLGNRSDRASPIKGMYVWGGVGRGKTFLMDLFFDTLQIDAKRRVHFHRIMQEVHARLGALDDTADPLDVVAASLADNVQVLCFDEFFVSDIGDAMILSRLLDGLFRRGVTLVTTSNSPPDDLYKDGLQRQRFLPAIELLKQHTEVVEMDSGTDYRLRMLEKAGTWMSPDDERAREVLQSVFDESASSAVHGKSSLHINGRDIPVEQSAKGIAWFEFEAICDGPRSQSDYIELARWFPEIIVSGVPRFGADREDQARRFIALVDEFYDRHVKLIVSAATAPADLYAGDRLRFEFERTSSRLVEMQSHDYLALPHLA